MAEALPVRQDRNARREHRTAPAGSRVRAVSPVADLTCEGPLGDCRLRTSLGGIRLDEAATAYLKTDHGRIRVDHLAGDAEETVEVPARTGVGDIVIRRP